MSESGGAVVERPTASEAATAIIKGLDRGHLVTLVGRCRGSYDGRASRRLDPADRVVLCKPDGTVLVHEAAGLQPVVYASSGANVEATVEGGCIVRAVRDDPPETLVVAFEEVEQVTAVPVETGSDPGGRGVEAALRDRILDDPTLLEPGFRPLATERETPAGPVDVFGRDAKGQTVVVEVKAGRVGPDAVGQLARYVEALEGDLHADATVRGVLVAPGVTERARVALAEHGLEFVPLSVE